MTAPRVVGQPARRRLPLIGHGLQLQRRPLEFFAEMHRQPEPMVRLQLGPLDAYLLTTPELILKILRGKESHFVEKGSYFNAMRVALGEGLVTASEPKHLRHRRLMQPAFHRDNIASYVRIMQTEATAMIEGWQDGQVIEFDEQMRELAMRISAKALFSSAVGEEVVTESLRSLPIIVAEIPKRTVLPWLSKVPLRNRGFDKAVRDLSGAIGRTIREYRDSNEEYDDLASMLLAARFDDGSPMTDQEVHDEVMTIYAASIETSANIMSFMWLELSRRPDILAKVEKEVVDVLHDGPVTADNIRQLVYLEQVAAETLRRYTPLWLSMREAVREFELEGVRFPVGTTLVYSPYSLHNDARYFDNPEVFDPDRWTMEYRKKVTRSGLYQPFGAGNRNCIGEPFAWFEVVAVIATLVQRLRLEPAGKHPAHEVARVALEPNELPMTVRLRPDSVSKREPDTATE